MYYNSPVLRTIVLTNLVGGATYTYRAAGVDRNFSFVMPPDGGEAAYPYVIGLTADLGQTEVSLTPTLTLANPNPHPRLRADYGQTKGLGASRTRPAPSWAK